MAFRHGKACRRQILRQLMGHRHAAVVSAGAAYGEHQHRLALFIIKGQQVQQQLQAVSTQKMQYDAQKREMARTLEELNSASGDVYKSAGSLLIKVEDKEKLKGELEESIETMEVRISSMDRQEKSLQEKFKILSDAINAAMGNARPAPAADDE